MAAGAWWIALIPGLPLLACVLCGLFAAGRVKSKLPAFTVFFLLAASFGIALKGFLDWDGSGRAVTLVHVLDWIHVHWGFPPVENVFVANIAFHMDGLSWLWMLFVTGLASAICLYASEYMAHDVGKGYARFFAAFALFVFSMSCLVMGDNLVLLYLGWEGVGLCSYLLIGYFYQKPSAVEAAKKAFIVNRIGDLGLAMGLFLIYVTFGTVNYAELFDMVGQGVDAQGRHLATIWQGWAIPCLLMIGAFGKSAQGPLYVWLPDAMEGPTPVSALIHAATMVTAGVYLVCRFLPLFLADPSHFALHIVAWVGALTALWSATIGMAQFDIKRIMAYSTVSQLGYMFAGVAVLSPTGGASHVFTHAFFKATLFLSCGAVMHGFAGQLDLRKLSGLWSQPGWKVVTVAMFVGCLNLAGFPFTPGFFSKDMILAEAFTTPGMAPIGWILLGTAGLTAYYTFRVFFRVFVGPPSFEPGDEMHGHDDHGHDEQGHGADLAQAAHDAAGHKDHAHDFHPHPPGWAINLVLGVLAVASLVAVYTFMVDKEHHGWVGSMLASSSASMSDSEHAEHSVASGDTPMTADLARQIAEINDRMAEDERRDGTDPKVSPRQKTVLALETELAKLRAANRAIEPKVAGHGEHGTFLGYNPHEVMYYVSAAVGGVGIIIAFLLHYVGRKQAGTANADKLLPMLGPVARWAQGKWYVDEFYEAVIRLPLNILSHVFAALDKLLVDGLVDLCGALPRMLARGLRPSQNGVLQSYATGMAGGLAVILLIVWLLMLKG